MPCVLILLRCRLWTRGYDVYTPSKQIFSKLHDPIMVETSKPYRGSPQLIMEALMNSLKRVSVLLGSPDVEISTDSVASLTKYGLGMKRNLDQLIEFTGIDLRKCQIYEVSEFL